LPRRSRYFPRHDTVESSLDWMPRTWRGIWSLMQKLDSRCELAEKSIRMSTLQTTINKILEVRRSVSKQRSVLVGVSGIDGSGKGYVTAQIVKALQMKGVRAVGINIDGWLNLPHKRFSTLNPPEHFYLHAIRFDQMFAQLVLPLRDHRSLRVEADFTEETAAESRRHMHEFEDIDVIVLEGIYLLKRTFRAHYDLSVWVECSFATALERAIARAQEGLPAEETVRVYRTVYFPAQEIHFQRDNPRGAATLIVNNDPRLDPALFRAGIRKNSITHTATLSRPKSCCAPLRNSRVFSIPEPSGRDERDSVA
jgi:uridine kinase